MEQLRTYFVDSDDLRMFWEDNVNPRRLRLSGRIQCKGDIFVAVDKTLEADDDDFCWCFQYTYQVCVGDPPRELFRYDNAHPHEGDPDEHHKHVHHPVTGLEVRGSPAWVGHDGWPTLREVIDEAWEWHNAATPTKPVNLASCARH